ncbi:MAG: hypothetical protein IJZ20_00930 [Clostridia bacterium]|nr:hypothetical protein [Clostridia bacterium]MBQ8758238.1 hypothetical protein [Clostridia bacterium]
MKIKDNITICDGTFCSETLCGDCIWLDYSQPTKSAPTYYWCKRVSSYKNPKLNTSCSHWNVND